MSPLPAAPVEPRSDPEHDARAVQAIARAHAEIPFYAKRGRPPIDPSSTLDDVLRATPLLTKADIRPTLPKQWVPPSVRRQSRARFGRHRARRDERLDARAPPHPLGQGLVDAPGGRGRCARTRSIARASPGGVRAVQGDDPDDARVRPRAPATSETCRSRSGSTSIASFSTCGPTRRSGGRGRHGPDARRARRATRPWASRAIRCTSRPWRATPPAHGRTIDVKGFVQLTYAFTTRGARARHPPGVRGAAPSALRRERSGRALHGGRTTGASTTARSRPTSSSSRCKVPTPGREERGARGGDDARSRGAAARALRRGRSGRGRPDGPTTVHDAFRRSSRSRAGCTTRSCGPTGRSSPRRRSTARSARATVAVFQVNQRDAGARRGRRRAGGGTRSRRAVEEARAALAPLFEGLGARGSHGDGHRGRAEREVPGRAGASSRSTSRVRSRGATGVEAVSMDERRAHRRPSRTASGPSSRCSRGRSTGSRSSFSTARRRRRSRAP